MCFLSVLTVVFSFFVCENERRNVKYKNNRLPVILQLIQYFVGNGNDLKMFKIPPNGPFLIKHDILFPMTFWHYNMGQFSG